VTPQVEKLRDDFDFPGMKVLQFGFDDSGPENPYLPFNFPQNCVCYTGTHDNDTTIGWWTSLALPQKEQVLAYVGHDGPLHWAMLRLAMSSIADSVVFPLQDVLGLGSDARMNSPGRAQGNWSWRYPADALTDELKGQLKLITTTYGRSPRFATNRAGNT
jgi:4-alpha-glucanotransferase